MVAMSFAVIFREVRGKGRRLNKERYLYIVASV